MIVVGTEGFQKNQYRKLNSRSSELVPGDDFGMMREVMNRRFKRLLTEAPRPKADAPLAAAAASGAAPVQDTAAIDIAGHEESDSPWPDLVIIDGGRGQLAAAQETVAELERSGAQASALQADVTDPAAVAQGQLVGLDRAGDVTVGQRVTIGRDQHPGADATYADHGRSHQLDDRDHGSGIGVEELDIRNHLLGRTHCKAA